MNNEIDRVVNAEFLPTIPREKIEAICSYKLPTNELKNYGESFAIIASEIVKVAINSGDTEGLFRCVFPEGVTGTLAKFKDGSGNLGTIVNKKGIAGQARWVSVEGQESPAGFDPVTLAIAVAVMSINKKLDDIKETQKEIVQFLQYDKESELEGAVNSLAEIIDNYRFNNSSDLWKGSQLTVTSTIKGKAEHNIIFYRKEINSILNNLKKIHGNRTADKMFNNILGKFKYYQLSIYLYSFSTFLEVILSENFESSTLEHITDKIRDFSIEYREDYSECYEAIKKYSESSIESEILGAVGKASTFLGEKIASRPILSKGPVDEALLLAGNKAEQLGSKQTIKSLFEFTDKRNAGILFLVEKINEINNICNKPVEVLFNKDIVYICA